MYIHFSIKLKKYLKLALKKIKFKMHLRKIYIQGGTLKMSATSYYISEKMRRIKNMFKQKVM